MHTRRKVVNRRIVIRKIRRIVIRKMRRIVIRRKYLIGEGC